MYAETLTGKNKITIPSMFFDALPLEMFFRDINTNTPTGKNAISVVRWFLGR